MDEGQLESAETLLNAAAELDPDFDGLDDTRASLELAMIEKKSSRPVSTRELTYVATAAPRYPRRAVDLNITGWVVIEFTVNPEGATQDIEVTQSDPPKVFNKAAIEAVEQWVFEPVVYRGQIISQRAGARLVFSLQ